MRYTVSSTGPFYLLVFLPLLPASIQSFKSLQIYHQSCLTQNSIRIGKFRDASSFQFLPTVRHANHLHKGLLLTKNQADHPRSHVMKGIYDIRSTSSLRQEVLLHSVADDAIKDDVSGDEFAERMKLLVKRKSSNKNETETNVVDENIKGEQWLSWSKQGKNPTKDADEIKIREPEELGGIPRSDRYASR